MKNITIIDEDKNVYLDEDIKDNEVPSEEFIQLIEGIMKNREIIGYKVLFKEPHPAEDFSIEDVDSDLVSSVVVQLKNIL